MRFSMSRLNPLPSLLRWVLAFALILNGVASPSAIAHANPDAKPVVATDAVPAEHCHHHDAAPSDATKHSHPPCPCCAGGDACGCGCLALMLPITFPHLRSVAPDSLPDGFRAPDFVSVAPHRLLRPPIV